jgi:hypothetical protein
MTDLDALPALVTVSQAFAARMPTQRVIDTVERAEAATFADIIARQPFRVVAFRALMRDHPDRDVTSLWLAAYDVEVAITEPDPTNGVSPTPGPLSATTGASGPTS